MLGVPRDSTQGRHTVAAARAHSSEDYNKYRHIISQRPDPELAADGLPFLSGPLPPSDQDYTQPPPMLHPGIGGGGRSSSGTGGFGGSRNTAPINHNDNFGRGTAKTRGTALNNNLLDDISEQSSSEGDDDGVGSSQVENMRRRIHELELENQKLNKVIVDQKEQLDANLLERDKMITEYDEYIDGLQEQLDQFNATEGLVEKLEEEKRFLQDEIDKVYKVKEMMAAQLGSQDESTKVYELRQQIKILQAEIERLKRQLRATGDVGENAGLKNRIGSLEKKMEFTEKENALYKTENHELNDQLRKARSKLEQLDSSPEVQRAQAQQQRQQQAQIQSLQQQLDDAKKAAKAASELDINPAGGAGGMEFGSMLSDGLEGGQQFGNPQKMKQAIQEKEEELKKVQEKLGKIVEKKDSEITRVKKDLEDLENQKNEEIEDLEQELKTLRSEKDQQLKDLKKQLRQKEDEISKAELNQMDPEDKQALEREKQDLEAEVEDLKNEIEGLQERIGGLEEEKKDLKSKNENLAKHISDLKEQQEKIQNSPSPSKQTLSGPGHNSSKNQRSVDDQSFSFKPGESHYSEQQNGHHSKSQQDRAGGGLGSHSASQQQGSKDDQILRLKEQLSSLNKENTDLRSLVSAPSNSDMLHSTGKKGPESSTKKLVVGEPINISYRRTSIPTNPSQNSIRIVSNFDNREQVPKRIVLQSPEDSQNRTFSRVTSANSFQQLNNPYPSFGGSPGSRLITNSGLSPDTQKQSQQTAGWNHQPLQQQGRVQMQGQSQQPVRIAHHPQQATQGSHQEPENSSQNLANQIRRVLQTHSSRKSLGSNHSPSYSPRQDKERVDPGLAGHIHSPLPRRLINYAEPLKMEVTTPEKGKETYLISPNHGQGQVKTGNPSHTYSTPINPLTSPYGQENKSPIYDPFRVSEKQHAVKTPPILRKLNDNINMNTSPVMMAKPRINQATLHGYNSNRNNGHGHPGGNNHHLHGGQYPQHDQQHQQPQQQQQQYYQHSPNPASPQINARNSSPIGPVSYVFNSVYQPRSGTKTNKSSLDYEMLGQPKMLPSMKNSNLSYGTAPLSMTGTHHPYEDSRSPSPTPSVRNSGQNVYGSQGVFKGRQQGFKSADGLIQGGL